MAILGPTLQGTPEEQLAQLEAKRADLVRRQQAVKLKALERDKEYLTKGKESWWEDFAEGLAVSGKTLKLGLQELIPGNEITPEMRGDLEDWKRDAGESSGGTAGEIVGEIASFILPALGGQKLVKAASKAPGLSRLGGGAGALLGETGGVAATAAARLPDEGDTRLGNAAVEGAGGLAGGLVGKVLGKAMRGARKTPEAQVLLDKGVNMSPGQQAEGAFVQNSEQILDYFPVFSRAGKELREEGVESWNKVLLNKAAPSGTTITKVGPAGGKQLEDAVKKGYADAWAGVGDVPDRVAFDVISDLGAASAKLGKKDKRVVNSVIDDIADLSVRGRGKSGGAIDEVLRRELATSGRKKFRLTETLKAARQELRDAAPDVNREALQEMDTTFPKYLTARDAIGRSLKNEGVFTPAQATTSVKSVGKKLAETGDAALQDAVQRGRATVGRGTGEPLPDAWRRFVRSAPSLGVPEFLGRTVMGNTIGQKAVQKGLANESALARALRSITDPVKLGAAATPND